MSPRRRLHHSLARGRGFPQLSSASHLRAGEFMSWAYQPWKTPPATAAMSPCQQRALTQPETTPLLLHCRKKPAHKWCLLSSKRCTCCRRQRPSNSETHHQMSVNWTLTDGERGRDPTIRINVALPKISCPDVGGSILVHSA